MFSALTFAQSCGDALGSLTMSSDGPFFRFSSTGIAVAIDNYIDLTRNSLNYTSADTKSQLLFSSWSNTATVETSTQNYNIANVNFDVASSTFVHKNGDQFMGFNIGAAVKQVTINGRSFKSIFSIADGKTKVYEIIYQDNSYAILKNYEVKVRERKMDSYTRRQEKKVILSSDYYVQNSNNGVVTAFKMNKKNLLKLHGQDRIAMESVKNFAK